MSRVVRTLTAALLAALIPGVAHADVRASPESTVTFDGTIQAVAYLGDRLYLGGDFTHAIDTAGKLVARSRLAAIDARTGKLLDWNPIADGRIRAIAATDRGVYVGGDFGSINGLTRDNLAQLDPVTGAPTGFRHSIYGHPHAIAVGGNRLYIGGTITQVDGVARSRLAAFDLTTGSLDPQWKPAAQDSVNAILVGTDRILLGGAFMQVNGLKNTARIAVVDPRTGAVRPTFRSTIGYAVSSLSMTGSVLYAAVAGKGGRAMALDATTGATKWTVTADGDVQSVVRVNDTIIMGGHFDRICKSAAVGDKGACQEGSSDRVKLAALDPSGRLLPWIADANGVMGVETMAASTRLGKVAAGGSFTQINGAQQRRFAQFRL
ncbi:MAG: PQQ-binding-like beta-propeller repeat protein [Hamadaea sp.]|uniref:outer membrane protein assembly factor BamB family protein n=1 Tax=Hamadaea sp. TaxID=2024425 RepID=UPI0017E5CAFD|nr:PQQ-binding-like beta-propeller repeat protein [Hamadaea sp.]NUT23569.1 PQQ-binding-like beta-propeller repeat protein [Hamadaea sp.]